MTRIVDPWGQSGDSYVRERKSDGAEIFTIKEERWARYWMSQAFPVLLVIRNSEGEVRGMEVRDWLKRASDDGRKPVKQIIFEGQRFDVMRRAAVAGAGIGGKTSDERDGRVEVSELEQAKRKERFCVG